MQKRLPFFCLLFITGLLNAQPKDNAQLLQLIQSFAKTSAITGREEEATKFVESLFAAGAFKKDKLDNLIMIIGSGSPKRLFATALDEPGYVVSGIQENGYLRITPLGTAQGKMYHQFLQGNEIRINTDSGVCYGVAVVPSAHFDGLRAVPERTKNMFQWQDAFIDVGAASAMEVAAKGIHLLDPLTANKKPQIINGEYIAGPSIKSKSAVIALAEVAKTLMRSKITGTVVIAFTTLELINGKGLEDVANKYGPFDEIVRFNRYLNGEIKERNAILADKKLTLKSQDQVVTSPVIAIKPSNNDLSGLKADIYNVGLPANYMFTPVEMVSINAVQNLAQTWLGIVEDKTWQLANLEHAAAPRKEAYHQTFQKENALVSKLVSLYGVSSAEKPVSDFIKTALPKWANPIADEKGNVIITFGKGKQHIAFVAHTDEVGYVVDSIREDGRLQLKQRGGFFNNVWEAHAAIVHAAIKEIPAVFEPRTDYMTATMKSNGTNAPTVYAGFTTKQQAIEAGIKEGTTTVTMPKQMIRLSENKATARGFDDRAGCASLLMALQNINPDQLPFKVTCVFSVEEETGLTGSTFAAKDLQDVSTVYPIDTYVSADDPVEPKIFADCPLGNGAVIRVLESVNIIRRKDLQYLQALAQKNNIKTQYGLTSGGTDGQGFLKYDIPSVPISWPGRYSHSPIEMMDFRDLKNLTLLIQAIMMDKGKVYE